MEALNENEKWTVSEVELVYRKKVDRLKLPKIKSCKHAVEILRNNWDDGKIDYIEQFKVMLLGRSNLVLAIIDIASGGTRSVTVDPKIIFTAALKMNASAIILAHNHPSGTLASSIQDDNLTKQLCQAGRLLDIPVLDHIIITSEGFYSYTNAGKL